jgi:sugar phosphate isomerase/epimerase
MEFIKFAKDFRGVELNFKKINNSLSEDIKLKDIQEILEIYNLKVCSIFRIKDFSLSSEKKYKIEVLSTLKKFFQYCDKLESDLIIVNPSKLNADQELSKIPKWKIVNRTRKRLENLSKLADSEDINIGFEFLSESSISTLKDAIEILAPMESIDNLGYIIDSFHIAKSKSDYTQLKNIKNLIFLIQLADIKYDKENLNDDLKSITRVFPGEGDFEFKEFLKFCQKIRYNKIYSIELLKNECSTQKLFQKFYRKFNTIL